jgi:hypothetical protein
MSFPSSEPNSEVLSLTAVGRLIVVGCMKGVMALRFDEALVR